MCTVLCELIRTKTETNLFTANDTCLGNKEEWVQAPLVSKTSQHSSYLIGQGLVSANALLFKQGRHQEVAPVYI